MKLIIHGDVIFEKIDAQDLPNGLKKAENNVVRLGETSGHRHEVMGGEVMVKDELMFVCVDKPTEVKHLKGSELTREHKTVVLPAGVWKVRDEVRYNYFKSQREIVKD